MKSIRRSLFRWLFTGLALFSAVAGVSLYAMVRAGLQARFDADLSHLAAGVPLIILAGESGRVRGASSYRWDAFLDPRGGQYYQVWTADGAERARSRSLGEARLLHPDKLGKEPRYWDSVLPSGERVRATGGRVELPGARTPAAGATNATAAARIELDLVVARNRAELDHSLNRLIAGISGVGLLIALGFALLVRFAVGYGLRPLRLVAEQTAAIGPDQLSGRFDEKGVPDELRPIIGRLNDLMARLETAFERERRFSANLAHELRTPVAELKTAAEVALRWPGASHEENYREVLEISDQMQTMIESLLALARPGRSAAAGTPEVIGVAAVTADCWRPFAEKAREKSIVVEHAVDAGMTLKVHTGLFRIILTNLFSNATEYTPPGGRIRVEFRQLDGDGFEFVSANTAHDLDPENIPHLFERFWRRDEARTGGKHHGLGLCVAKSCAQAMACALTAELDPQRQWLAFHLRRAAAPEAPASA
jgi:signal transduction histidine kinase